jgi:hypothetical protein
VDDSFHLLFGVALGIGLAAATGFRVFVPLLVAGLAARAGWVPLTESFAWLQSTPALVALSTAAVLEILAFHEQRKSLAAQGALDAEPLNSVVGR